MPKAIHFRIAGQLATLGVQGINSYVMFNLTHDHNLLKDPEIETMVSMQGTYLTIWNVVSITELDIFIILLIICLF